MNEMIGLLKRVSQERGVGSAGDEEIGRDIKKKKKDDDDLTSKIFVSRTKNRFRLPRLRLPSLPPCCHPIRKEASRQKKMIVLLLAMSILVTLSALNHFGEGRDSLDTIPLSSLTSFPESITNKVLTGGGSDKTLYFHTKMKRNNNEHDNDIDNLDNLASLLSKNFYPYGTGSVICILVSNRPKDVEDIQVALKSLAFLQGEQNRDLPLAPVLVFHEGDLTKKQMKSIRDATGRPIAFPTVDLTSFPPGFEPDAPVSNAPPGFEVANRKPWGYYQMIRFWLTTIWDHPAIQRFDVIMRMDSDSCFTEPNAYLPQMLHDHLVYQSQYVGTEPPAGRPYIEGLYEFATSYLEGVHKFPGNAMLWQFIQTTWKEQNTLPLFRTNFELSKLSFMQRTDVKKWHKALTEEEPYGVLSYRWGDAVIRFFDAAIFATDETTLTMKPDGYNHKQKCSWPEVRDALERNKLLP